MPSRKRGGNPEEAGIPPRFEKGGYLSETALCVSGRYPKKADKGGEEGCSFSREDRLPKKEKGGTSPTYAAATRCQIPQKDGDGRVVRDFKLKPTTREVKSRKAVTRAMYWFDRGVFLVFTGMPRPVLGESILIIFNKKCFTTTNFNKIIIHHSMSQF